MDWEAIGSIAEAIGSLFVLISVLYLAVQLRQNTNIVKSESHHAVTDTCNAVSTLIAQDSRMARLWRMGNAGSGNPISLSDEFRQYVARLIEEVDANHTQEVAAAGIH